MCKCSHPGVRNYRCVSLIHGKLYPRGYYYVTSRKQDVTYKSSSVFFCSSFYYYSFTHSLAKDISILKHVIWEHKSTHWNYGYQLETCKIRYILGIYTIFSLDSGNNFEDDTMETVISHVCDCVWLCRVRWELGSLVYVWQYILFKMLIRSSNLWSKYIHKQHGFYLLKCRPLSVSIPILDKSIIVCQRYMITRYIYREECEIQKRALIYFDA